MILGEIKTYLSDRGRAPLNDIALHFNSDPDAIRGMLEHYIRKGQVQHLDTGATCGGCNKCDAFALEIYEWTQGKSEPEADEATETCQIGRALS